jgi:EAL domain-containing protein (putative c-di-GMP-specific phosphodiesterase class I)
MLTLRRQARPVPRLAGLAGVEQAESWSPSGIPLAQPLTPPRLAIFMPWLTRLSVGFGLLETVAGAAAHERAFIAAGALTTGFVAVVLVARHLAGKGREIQATWLVAVSLGVIGFIGTLIVPGVDEAMSLLPLLAVALLMPYATGRLRLPIVGLGLISTALILVGADLGRPGPTPVPLGGFFAHAILVGIAGLVIAALVDFSDNAARSLRALNESVILHRDLRDERVALGRVLESLEPKATVEATAHAIAEALVTLPGINVGGVLEYHDGGLRVLGVAAPSAFPLHTGDRIPEAHARSLIASSTSGPWAEPTRELVGPAVEGDAGSAIGLQASAYAPMRSGEQLIGLIGIGTSDPQHARHLVEDLPAVGEVAATATALLAPALLARREVANVRGRIQTIINERAFMPVFQAIATIPGREVVAYEALTRFTDGVRPDRHFADATAAGLGVELELVTLKAAVLAAERIPYALWLTLNVSPAAIESGDRLGRILRRSHHQLALELTEHVAVADYGRLRGALGELGVPFRIAVDDAGAGYASMMHVVELGPSLVKLDLSLVRGIDADPVRQALITGMLYFAERTDCRLVAEGIETEAEFAALAALGVPLGQGFLLGRPGEFVPARTSDRLA